MRTLTVIAMLLLAASLAQPAQAQGGLRELMRERMAEKIEAMGEDDRPGCVERDKKMQKMLDRRGNNAGPEPSLADVSYGPKPRQTLDIFLPKKSDTPAPIIFMVHGGGWCIGDKVMKSVTENKVGRWVPRGFVFISANYPMIGDNSKAGGQAADIARAVAYVQKHAAEWGGDGGKVIVMGHSAGAHLISLVNADGELKERMGVQPLLGAVSLDSGAINLVTQMPLVMPVMKETYQLAFGTDAKGWPALSPYHRLDPTAAPWLGVCSSQRKDSPCVQAKEYTIKSEGFGVRAEVLPLDKSHRAINAELGLDSDYTRAVEKFMASLDNHVASLLKR